MALRSQSRLTGVPSRPVAAPPVQEKRDTPHLAWPRFLPPPSLKAARVSADGKNKEFVKTDLNLVLRALAFNLTTPALTKSLHSILQTGKKKKKVRR